MADVSCLHGSWQDGVCVCEPGYLTKFNDRELYPIYCSEKDDVLIVDANKGYQPLHFLQYITLSLTIGGATASGLWFVFFLYTVLDTYLLGKKIVRAQRKLEQFRKTVVRRDSTENLNTELWYPDLKFFKCVNDPGLTEEEVAAEKEEKIVYAKVLHDYKPRAAGELKLHIGDTIKNVVRLDKGWCKGDLNGKVGFYPEAYASMFQPTESDIEEFDSEGGANSSSGESDNN